MDYKANGITKSIGLPLAIEYCKNNNLSVDKLNELKYNTGYPQSAFVKPKDNIINRGLSNDIETMPELILFVRLDEDKLVIEETDLTREYLSL